MDRTEANVPFRMELMFSNGLKCQWDECVKYAKLLSLESRHAPACTTYIEAIFQYVLSQDLSDEDMKETATKLFALVIQKSLI